VSGNSSVPHFVRTAGLFSKKNTLEHLHTFPRFPVFLGCTDAPPKEDLFLDMSFSICTETGLIQLDALPDESILYQLPHVDAYGSVWNQFTEQFAAFVVKNGLSGDASVLEIGGGTGKLATAVLARHPNIHWLLIDPNPTCEDTRNLLVKRMFFNESSSLAKESFDVIVHSHVIEHMFDVEAFLGAIYAFLKPSGSHIFCLPNFNEMLHRGYPNTINFEHTQCLNEEYIAALLENAGFAIVDKQYFRDDHSVFFYTKKSADKKNKPMPNLYQRTLGDWKQFENGLYDAVNRMNASIAKHDGPIYLFGAHIFTQYLIAAGLNISNIAGLLDNSDLKHKRRLYGTGFISEKPDIIRGATSPAVVLRVAQYRDEIVDQLRQINPGVVFFE